MEAIWVPVSVTGLHNASAVLTTGDIIQSAKITLFPPDAETPQNSTQDSHLILKHMGPHCKISTALLKGGTNTKYIWIAISVEWLLQLCMYLWKQARNYWDLHFLKWSQYGQTKASIHNAWYLLTNKRRFSGCNEIINLYSQETMDYKHSSIYSPP